MKTETIFSLTEYQRGILTEMGISCWQQVANCADTSKTDNYYNNEDVNSSHTSRIDGLIEPDTSAESQNRKQPVSIPQHILLLISETQSAHPIIKDVLNALKLPLDISITFSTGDLEDYADYLLAWAVAPEIGLNGTILSTPDLPQLSSPATKKHLWQILQNCHLFV